jgi:mono/diheme cytochrome c family protein
LGFATPSLALAAEKSLGQLEYENNCASCHGLTGKGDGMFTQFLKTPPPSLRALKKNNGGVFPSERVYQIIDGRAAVKGHGGSEMPIWGKEYSAEAQKAHDPFFAQIYGEQRVRGSILTLIEYISRLQD